MPKKKSKAQKKEAKNETAEETGQERDPKDEVEDAVVALVSSLSSRIAALLPHTYSEMFDPVSFESFSKELDETEDDYAHVPKSGRLVALFAALEPLAATFVKDIGAAKMLLGVIFEDFAVDKDLKLGHDALKEQVFAELFQLESSVQQSVELWEQYHNYRTDKAVESKINVGSEDLRLSLWLLDEQIARENESMLLQMVRAYFNMMETIRETYDLLQVPGVIGRRKAGIKAIRRDLYG